MTVCSQLFPAALNLCVYSFKPFILLTNSIVFVFFLDLLFRNFVFVYVFTPDVIELKILQDSSRSRHSHQRLSYRSQQGKLKKRNDFLFDWIFRLILRFTIIALGFFWNYFWPVRRKKVRGNKPKVVVVYNFPSRKSFSRTSSVRFQLELFHPKEKLMGYFIRYFSHSFYACSLKGQRFWSVGYIRVFSRKLLKLLWFFLLRVCVYFQSRTADMGIEKLQLSFQKKKWQRVNMSSLSEPINFEKSNRNPLKSQSTLLKFCSNFSSSFLSDKENENFLFCVCTCIFWRHLSPSPILLFLSKRKKSSTFLFSWKIFGKKGSRKKSTRRITKFYSTSF